MYGEKIHLNIKPFKCTMFMTIDVILEKKKIDLRFIIALSCEATPLKNIRHKFQFNWASEASPTLGCSIEISRDIYIYVHVSVVVQKA